MRIKTKIFLTVLGLALLVALVSGLTVKRERASAQIAVSNEAEHVARVLGFLISDPTKLPASCQEIVAKLHQTQGHEVVLVDAQQHILADAVPTEVGKTYSADPGNEVGLTIKDRKVRTLIETNKDSPGKTRQIVVPVEAATGQVIGAVVLDYTPFYDEQMHLTTTTIHEVVLIGALGATAAILCALFLSHSITAPLRRLTQAATGFAAGRRDLPMPASGTDEIDELVTAFHRMMEKREESEEALRQTHDELEGRVAERTAKLAEASEALTWKTAFLEASVNSSLDGILVVDSQGKRILQNQQMIDVWKMPRDIAEEPGDENRLRWVTNMTRHPERFIEKVVYLYSHPDEVSQDEIELKDRTILERYSSPVHGRDGQYCGRIWKFRDITERKQADQAQARFAAIMEMTTDLVCVADPDGRVLYVNRAGRRMMGFGEHEDVTQTSIADYQAGQRIGNESIPTARREGVWSGESMFVSRDGREFPLAQVVVAHKGLDGEVDFMATTGQDLTEHKKADAALEEANRLVRDGFRQAGMAEVATSVLHNVGNVLNSVNVSCSVISEKVGKSRIGSLAKIAALLEEHTNDLALFLTTDPTGKKLPDFFHKLASRLGDEQMDILRELHSLDQNIEHIKDIINVQQSYARGIGGLRETLQFEGLVEDALRLNGGALVRHRIEVVREFGEVPAVPMEKHKVIQILVNLIRNAKHALADSDREQKRLAIAITRYSDRVAVTVSDNGVGIAPENLNRIFAHGFTTKRDGHGFGLHSGALAAREMGGSLVAQSDGPGGGAVFTLSLPVSLQEQPVGVPGKA